jgi:hypothetical protein
VKGSSILAHALQVVKAAGYVVIPSERHVVLDASYSLPLWTKGSMERLMDCALVNNAERIARAAAARGLFIEHKREVDDPATGREVIVSHACAFIKPKEADEV